jgi:cytochrome P450
MGLRTPPMVKGLPLLGSLLEWRRDHLGVFMRAYQRYGPVFSIALGPQKGVVLIGPEYHDFYFKEVDRTLSVPELYRFVIPMFGDVMMAATDMDRRRRHVALLQSAFQGGRLAHYTDVMTEEVDSWLETLGEHGEFELWDTIEPLVMRIAASALLGPEIRARVHEFRPLLVDLARGMEFVLPPGYSPRCCDRCSPNADAIPARTPTFCRPSSTMPTCGPKVTMFRWAWPCAPSSPVTSPPPRRHAGHWCSYCEIRAISIPS